MKATIALQFGIAELILTFAKVHAIFEGQQTIVDGNKVTILHTHSTMAALDHGGYFYCGLAHRFLWS